MRFAILRGLTFVVLLAFSRLAAAQFDTTPAEGGSQLGQSQTQLWEFGAGVTATGGPCMGLLGTAPVPADWPEQQVKVVKEDVSTHVRKISYRKSDGLTQLVFEVPQLPRGETARAFVVLEITRRELLPPSDPSGLAVPKETPREVRKYLGPSPMIEAASPKVKSLAKELTADKATAWEQVEAICDGIREKIRFEAEGRDVVKGAVATIRDGKADKEDLNALFVACCRAHKVPARMVWLPDLCYAEFYLESAEGKGAWYPCQVHDQKQFGGMKDLRPILMKGDNFKVPEKKEPQRFVTEFLTGKGGGGRPDVEFRRRLTVLE